MTQQSDEKQVLNALELLSPQGKKDALRILLSGYDRINRMIEDNQKEFIKLCEDRGIDFHRLSEEEREQLMDDIIHED